MSVQLVTAFKIKVPKDITFTSTPDDAVVSQKGTLFRKEGNQNIAVKQWNSTELKNGVKFTADANADRFEVVLTAQVSADSKTATTTTFDPQPPAADTRDVAMKGNEGIAERLWLFLPIKTVAAANAKPTAKKKAKAIGKGA